ncbi:MAG: hypothetical protein U0325_30855 [Polyangiales bacterium]
MNTRRRTPSVSSKPKGISVSPAVTCTHGGAPRAGLRHTKLASARRSPKNGPRVVLPSISSAKVLQRHAPSTRRRPRRTTKRSRLRGRPPCWSWSSESCEPSSWICA